MGRLKKVKQNRIHHEGIPTLLLGFAVYAGIVALSSWFLYERCPVAFWTIVVVFAIVYAVIVNFFRCPIRIYEGEMSDNVVVAPADGHVVVIEEVEEHEYFHDRRLMVSIFMSITNVHANWFPVQGIVRKVRHHNGNFMRAWLPKASTENERSTIVIQTASGHDVLVRQVAGAVARRIVTYATEGQECYIDNHMGFIKFGSRVDVYLPLDTDVKVALGQATTGNQTIIAMLKDKA
ncbi:MAG: phosphatidylserine decarboxylase family protein [Alloprevotella sp.]